jgi:lysophospholipase L1-like esterase
MRSHREPPRRPRPLLLAGAGLGLLGLLLWLVWTDHLPGAFRLRGWVQGRGGREAWLASREAAIRLQGFRRERQSVREGSVIFLGSSCIARFPLESCFRPGTAVNRGVEGDTTASLLARLDLSLPRARPGGFVVQIGANDLRREGRSPEEVRDGLAAVLRECARRAPLATIAVLGLLPSRNESPHWRARLERTNLLCAELARVRGAVFIPTDRAPLVDQSGSLADEYSVDTHHLSPAGYELLAGWILAEGGLLARRLAP